MGHGGGNGIAGQDFRGRNDDGDETGATWIAGVNENWSQRPDRNFRIRQSLSRNVFTLFTVSWWLYYSLNNGAFTQVTTSSAVVRSVSTIHYSEGEDCTQQLPDTPPVLFIADNNGMVENINVSSGACEWDGTPAGTENEMCIQIIGDDVNDGDSIKLRNQNGAASWSQGYFNTPDITVDIPRTIRRMIII